LTEVSAGPAVLSGKGTLQNRGNALNVKSSLQAVEARLKQPVNVDSTLQFDRASGKANVAPLEIRSGKVAIRGSAQAETNATPITFRADLRSDGAPVADLLSTAQAFRMAQGVSGTGTMSVNLHLEGRGEALSYSGTVSLPEASIVPSAGAQPVRLQSATVRLNSSEPLTGNMSAGKLTFDQISLSNLASDFRFANGVLRLEPVRAQAFGGNVAGNILLDTRGSSKLTATAKLTALDANQLLTATTAVKELSGKLSADADLNIAPPPGQNVARGLNGTVRLLLTDGKLSGIHLLDQLGQVARFTGATGTSSRGFTSISKLAGTLRIDSGVARTDDLQLDFDGGTLTATGTTDLATETLDLNVAALLNKGISEQVGGTRIAGYLTTALANPKGELMIPAKVTGTFAKPRFMPDPARLAKMRFGSVSGAAATAQGLLDQFTKPKQGQTGGKESLGEQAKPFVDLFNSLGKKKETSPK
jgi:hypothetical protein